MARRETYSDEFFYGNGNDLDRLIKGEGVFSAEKMRRILLKIINNELTARQKEIIMLYYYKGTTEKDAAEALGVSQQTVSKTLSRARLRIYRVLRYYVRGGADEP